MAPTDSGVRTWSPSGLPPASRIARLRPRAPHVLDKHDSAAPARKCRAHSLNLGGGHSECALSLALPTVQPQTEQHASDRAQRVLLMLEDDELIRVGVPGPKAVQSRIVPAL